jgi:hypothetical protein
MASICLAVITSFSASAWQPRVQPSGVCLPESAKLAGTKAVTIDEKIRPPKRTRHVQPSYPRLPPDTVGSGHWIGEARVDAQGKVSHVWVVREPTLTPPYPPFGKAIVDAIRQWEFEPLELKGVPTPFCMTVTIMLDWE